jgi:adenine-specific DNA-methyltransferase
MTSKVYNEDVFETMKRIKTGSINLIICDSPYFKICGGFDWTFKTMQEWIDWHILLRDEFERIMADNGSLFVFGDEKNIAYLQVEFDKKFNLLNNIVYRKSTCMAMKGIEDFNSSCQLPKEFYSMIKERIKQGLR